MKPNINDTVQLLDALSEWSIPKGAIGVIVEEFSDLWEAYEVEFTDSRGATIAQVTLKPNQFIVNG